MKKMMAWGLFWLTAIGWPLSHLWWAKDEPQFVLALSWLAILVTAVDGIWIVEKDDD